MRSRQPGRHTLEIGEIAVSRPPQEIASSATAFGPARRAALATLFALLIALGSLTDRASARPWVVGPAWGGGFGISRVAVFGGGWRGAWCGPGWNYAPWPAFGWNGCLPAYGWNCGWPAGWGYGGCWPVMGTAWCGTGFAVGGTRFWSGSTFFGVPGCIGGPVWGGWNPCWNAGWNPGWCGPAWGGWNAGSNPGWCGPAWGGGAWRWYSGWNAGTARGWNRPALHGWNFPCAAVAPAVRPPLARPVAAVAAAAPAAGFGGRDALHSAVIDAPVAAAIRTSNAAARGRAMRLVALGDGHLRDAIEEPKRIAKAIDAYRRAAAIAPDQPDIHLRHSIALVAAGKRDAADAAIARAVAIDSRLAGPAHRDDLPRVAALPAVSAADARGSKIVAKIFSAADAAPGGAVNWIARAWTGRQGAGMLAAARP